MTGWASSFSSVYVSQPWAGGGPSEWGFTCRKSLESSEPKSAKRVEKDILLIEYWQWGSPLYNYNNPYKYTQSLMRGLIEMNYYFNNTNEVPPT